MPSIPPGRKHHGQLATLGVRCCGDRDRRGRNRCRDRQVALGRKGDRLLSVPQGRQRLRQRHGLGSGRAPIGRPYEKLSIDIGGQPLEGDQLTTGLFETVIIESEAELDTAIGDAALGNEAPDDLLQDLLKVHASAPFAATFVLAPGWSLSRLKLRNRPAK